LYLVSNFGFIKDGFMRTFIAGFDTGLNTTTARLFPPDLIHFFS